MMINTKTDSIRQSRSRFIPRVLCLILGLIWLPFLSALSASAAITAAEVTIPQQLGTVHKRVDGLASQPFIFVIGEQHVSLKIQQTVADILRYLSGAYNVNLVCTEGYDKPLVVSHQRISLVAQRFTARADLAARRISGVEYFARAYPEVSVVGVEDMKAHELHAKQLDKQSGLAQEAEQWGKDFKKFLDQDFGNLKVTADGNKRLEAALKKLIEDKDFAPFTEAVYQIAGRESAVSKKLTTLEERRKVLQKSAQAGGVDSPAMQARDKAMITATLRTIGEKKVNVAVLVVGRAHLEGIERLLGEKKISYVSVVPAGVDESSKGDLDNEDQKVFRDWQQGKRIGIEQWLARIKNSPALSRATARDRTALLNILATTNHLSRQGLPENEVLRVIKQSPLPDGISIDRVFAINSGYGMEFTAKGKKGYAYFTGNADQLKIPGGPDPVEIGQSGGMHYAIYDGGGSNKPPIPPRRGGGGGNGPPNPPTGGFHDAYRLAIVEQKKKRPERVTIWFAVEDGGGVRWVDDGPKVVLNVTPSMVEDLRKSYERAPLGPEKVFAAQQLADVVLVDLNSHFPQGRTELIQISENNLMGDVSLPLVQELAHNRDASSLERIDKTRVYMSDWKDSQQNLSSKLGDRIDDKEQAKKRRAKEIIERETKGDKLKDVLAKTLTEAAKAKFAPEVTTLAQATRI